MEDLDKKRNVVGELAGDVSGGVAEVASEGIVDSIGESAVEVIGGVGEAAGEVIGAAVGGILDGI